MHHKWQECHCSQFDSPEKHGYRFLPAWIFICTTARVLPFRQGLLWCLRPQVVTCGYEGYCLSGKSEPVNWRLPLRWISVFEGIFGLKSRIFITAAFSLRHESSSETCPEGSTFICHEGAKTRSRLRPQNIITPVLPGGSTCPLILRGQSGREFIGKSINRRVGKLSTNSNLHPQTTNLQSCSHPFTFAIVMFC